MQVKMNCCGERGSKEEKKDGQEEHSHASHAGCRMHGGGGLLYWLGMALLLYLLVAYVFP
ncbi:MAG: hypothetical protein GXO66_07025 [Euryarchaeota archaeon]|nr:hypothetical protein [Euryarchaeota archaeon]